MFNINEFTPIGISNKGMLMLRHISGTVVFIEKKNSKLYFQHFANVSWFATKRAWVDSNINHSIVVLVPVENIVSTLTQ